MEVLTLDGPATVTKLAHRTGQAVGNVSHHLKVLARAGLAAEAPELARDKRERWWRQVPAVTQWSIAEVGDDVSDRIIAEETEQEALAYHVRWVRQWSRRREAYDEAWVRAAYAGDAWVRLTAEELTELGRRIDAVIREFTADRKDDEQARESVFVFAHAVPAEP